MSFRDNLQHLRAERNMTQEQLAMLLGVSRQSVTKWEAEKSYPEMDKLLKMCDIFECSLDDLIKGTLTQRTPAPNTTTIPAGPPQDICGYDEHQRMMARKIPAGIAAILVSVALGFLINALMGIPDTSDLFAVPITICVLTGVLIALALFIPAGLEHTAFVRAHPFIEDFYTEEERLRTRKAFARALITGIAMIFASTGISIALEWVSESTSLYMIFALLMCIALGVWLIVRYGMLMGRINLNEYNKSVVNDLEIEEIMTADLEDSWRDALLRKKRRNNKLSAVYATVMILATIAGLVLLFVPVFQQNDLDSFNPLGTSATWFWVAWPIGGMICGIIALLANAFKKDNK